jgi:hypothetical protein
MEGSSSLPYARSRTHGVVGQYRRAAACAGPSAAMLATLVTKNADNGRRFTGIDCTMNDIEIHSPEQTIAVEL